MILIMNMAFGHTIAARSGEVKDKKERNNETKKHSTKNRLIKKFFTIVISIVSVFVLTSVLVAMCYSGARAEKQTDKLLAEASKMDESKDLSKDTNTEETEKTEETDPPILTKTNVAVFGTDKEGIRTDVNFVVSFDSETKKIAFVSVPRDTKVQMTDEILKSLKDRNKFIPSKDGVMGVCKFNEVHAYAGKDYANEFSVLQLEDMLGIKIDYFVKVDINGFKDIVDAIGGVDMEVAENLYYSDPYQDLYINLKAGYQNLDGDKAEQLVRFREGYAQKDLKRIQVQQDFMKAFIKKILETETLISNLPNLITTAFKYVETDFGVSDALKYVKYLKDINLENVSMETIPGEGGSYFTLDEKDTKELVDRVFYSNDSTPPIEASKTEQESIQTTQDSTKLAIEISNGGITKGLAGNKKEMLEEKGYQVAFVSTFSGEKTAYTRIVVKESGVGEDLKESFPNAEIEIMPAMISNGTEIKIILGLDEK